MAENHKKYDKRKQNNCILQVIQNFYQILCYDLHGRELVTTQFSINVNANINSVVSEITIIIIIALIVILLWRQVWCIKTLPGHFEVKPNCSIPDRNHAWVVYEVLVHVV